MLAVSEIVIFGEDKGTPRLTFLTLALVAPRTWEMLGS